MLVGGYNLKPKFSSGRNEYQNVIEQGTSWELSSYHRCSASLVICAYKPGKQYCQTNKK